MLSSVAGAGGLKRAEQQFRDVGVPALMLTKLDEASGLGNLLPLFARLQVAAELPDPRAERARRHRTGRLPELARALLGMGKESRGVGE